MSVSFVALDELVGPAVKRILARNNIGVEASHFVRRAAEPSHDELMYGLVKDFEPAWAKAFSETNKILPNPRTGEPEAVTRVNDLTYGSLFEYGRDGRNAVQASRESDLRMSAHKARRGRDKRPKVYKLIDFFNDPSVSIKFGLNEADLQLARRTAVIDPGAACRGLSERLRTVGETCTIVPGDYANGLKAARVQLHEALRASRASKPIVDLMFMGDNAYCEGPRDHGGRPTWSVKGSEANSPEVAVVARLVVLHGVATVRALFEEQLFKCGISLIEESGPLIGSFEFHYGGNVPDCPGVAGNDGALLPEQVRLAAGRVLPLFETGRPVATAVRMSSDTSYANWHVMNRHNVLREVSIGYDAATADQVGAVHEVAPDVWCVQHQELTFSVGTWVTREADVSERCVFVYFGGRGPEFSDGVDIVRKEGSSLVTTRPSQAKAGMSGAALVAMSDGALLAIYRGASIDMCSCAVVGHSTEPMLSAAAVASAMSDADRGADCAYDNMVSRGLHDVLDNSVQALVPLFVRGKLYGYGVRHGSHVYTTIDCDVHTLSDVGGYPLPFVRVEGGRFRAELTRGGTSLSYVRLPRVGERIFVVGNDDGGVYLSSAMDIFRLASDGQGFWVSGDPASGSTEDFVYNGALIVAESDGCVLGQYADVVPSDAGPVSRCIGLASRTSAITSKRESLFNSIAPEVMVELWSDRAVNGLLNRNEEVTSQFSGLGASAIQTSLMLEFSRTGSLAVSGEEMTAAVSVVCDNNWVGARAYDCGFHHVMASNAGVSGRPADRLADSFRAFIGMVATWHGIDVVVSMLRTFGWYDYDWSVESSRLSVPKVSPVLPQFPFFGSRTSTPSPVGGRYW